MKSTRPQSHKARSGHSPSNGKSNGNGHAAGGAKTAAAKPAGTNVHGGNGHGKYMNPDSSPLLATAAQPGMVESDRGQRTDEQLIAAYRSGDRSSFAELVGRYQRELFHFLIRFLGDRAAAEDVFQETFLQIHQSAENFDTQRRFRPWLFTIAANKARDLIRANARRPVSPLQASISPGDDDSSEFIDLMKSATDLPDEPMQQQELQNKVKQTVMNMPEHLREILLLSYFHQFPYKQISDILDIPLGTVKSRLHAAVAHFADRWRSANPSHAMS
ncbi:MAG TPA: sigma-70 family RNA polymerase sigma factor [Tepidisphaeraceae bacterium]|nr:sigma-70 family RNA polymerase sigma factor [Tepidisphaeraceae bacterium]